MTAEITRVLDDATKIGGVLGAVVVEKQDGLVVAESIMEGIRSNAVAALAASMYNRLRRSTNAAGLGDPEFVQLQADDGVLVTLPAGEVLLVAVGVKDLNVGLVRLELKKVVEVLG